MQYSEYKDLLMKELHDVAAQDGFTVQEGTVDKVNLPQRESLSVKMIGKDVAATYYPEDLYKRYEAGESIQEQVKFIRSSAGAGEEQKFDLDLSADEIMNKSFPELIGVKGNESLLKDTPHRLVGDDMALITRVSVGDNGSFIVKDNIAQNYKLSKNELIEQALENQESQKYSLLSLHQKMVEMMGGAQDIYPEEGPQIMVLTNESNVFGAAEIMNRKAMQEASDRLNSDEQKIQGFFILPASLHETLLVPVSENDKSLKETVESLKDMVRSVNETTVATEDLLSYSVYYFDSAKMSLTNADKMNFSIQNTQTETENMSHHM